MAGGPAVRRRRGGPGHIGERGGNVHEGRDSAVEPARRQAGEGGAGPEEEPVSDAVFLLRGKHVRRRAEGAAGLARIGGHGGEVEEREGDAEEHSQLLDRRVGGQRRFPVVVVLFVIDRFPLNCDGLAALLLRYQ